MQVLQPDKVITFEAKPLPPTSHSGKQSYEFLCKWFQASYTESERKLVLENKGGGEEKSCDVVFKELSLGPLMALENPKGILVKYIDHRNVSILAEGAPATPEEVQTVTSLSGQSPCELLPPWLTLLGLELTAGSHLWVDGVQLVVGAASSGQPELCMHGTETPAPGPLTRTAALLETYNERQRRTLASGSSTFRVHKAGEWAPLVVEICTIVQEQVTATTLRFLPEDRSLLIRVSWPESCRPSPGQVEFSFGRLVSLKEQSMQAANDFIVELPLELLDAYPIS